MYAWHNTDEVAEPNVFAVTGAVAAFDQGADWLDQLRNYIYENKKTVAEFVENQIPDLYLLPSEATYLLWLDCSKIAADSQEFADYLREETGLFVSHGVQYRGDGRSFRVLISPARSDASGWTGTFKSRCPIL